MNRAKAILLCSLISVVSLAGLIGGLAAYQCNRSSNDQRATTTQADEREKHYRRVNEMLYDGSSEEQIDAYIKKNLPEWKDRRSPE